jgi:UTP--glucose-1-phosphate uridylyltransferase
MNLAMMHSKFGNIRKAIFPVAGLGTRFLPATKAIPKEMLCVVDKPLIQYAVEEAAAAGITDMIFVTSRHKRAIEDHFDKAHELEHALASQNKIALLDALRGVKPKGVECFYLRQADALGLGHAVLCAEQLVKHEPFAVILADDLLDAQKPVLRQMTDLFSEHECSILGVEQIEPDKSASYGVIDGRRMKGGLHWLDGIVEKPAPENAPSNLGVVGRYILTPAIFGHLRSIAPGAGGELQLTDAIASLLTEDKILAYEFAGVRYDCGTKIGYLRATVDFALKHLEVDDEFAEFLIERMSNKLLQSDFRGSAGPKGIRTPNVFGGIGRAP